MGLSFYSGILIAKYLGPEGYGNYNFLIGVFVSLINLLDMGSSSAFYTFISKSKKSIKFYILYSLWLLIQLSIMIFLVKLLPHQIKQSIWMGQTDQLVLLSLFSTFFMRKVWQFSSQISESFRDTIYLQYRNMFLSISHLGFVYFLCYFQLATIENLLFLNIYLYVFISIIFGFRLYRMIAKGGVVDTPKKIFKQFKLYCYPLIPYQIIGFLYSFFDLWFLQFVGGATEQGYYAIGHRFSAMALVATTSILQVFWKEISEAYDQNNFAKAANLYRNIQKKFFFVVAIFSVFFILNINEIISLFLGELYIDAAIPLALMFLHTIFQSSGQISSTVLYSIGKTKTVSVSGIIFMLVSMITTYLFLAPDEFLIPGFDLGSKGLALKMVICNILVVNFYEYFSSKYLKISFSWRYQFILVPIFFLGISVNMFVEILLDYFTFSVNDILVFFISGFIYFPIIYILARSFPSLFGFKKFILKEFS